MFTYIYVYKANIADKDSQKEQKSDNMLRILTIEDLFINYTLGKYVYELNICLNPGIFDTFRPYYIKTYV